MDVIFFTKQTYAHNHKKNEPIFFQIQPHSPASQDVCQTDRMDAASLKYPPADDFAIPTVQVLIIDSYWLIDWLT